MTRNLLVTGATSGIGAAIVLGQLSSGAKVLATGRSNRRLARLQQAAADRRLDENLQTVSADLADDPERQGVLDAVNAFHGGRLDALVHAAFGHIGEGEGVSVLEQSPENIRRFLGDSIEAALLTTLTFGPLLREGGGRIIFVVADWGLPQHNILLSGSNGENPIGSEAYVAAKYGLSGLANALELQGGLLTSAIYPGVVASWSGQDDNGEPLFLDPDASNEEQTAAGYAVPDGAIPLSDLAASVEFILSMKSSVRTLVLKPRGTSYVGL